MRLLHDRRIPGTRANIDHIAIAPAGIFVIGAKRYTGRRTLRITGGLLRPRAETLYVGRRDCSKLVTSVLNQSRSSEQPSTRLATTSFRCSACSASSTPTGH